MPTSPLKVVIQHFLADLGPDGGALTDGELLARFLSSRDDNALAAVVRRHAPMVWGVCCRLLSNHHDAEDAFQATFLVLVRKAADVPRQAVANWLYGVARQTAVRLRALAAKRRRRERQVGNMPELSNRSQSGVRSQQSGVRSHGSVTSEQELRELQFLLDEELGRLPAHYRGALVLCDLEGMTRNKAARQLGIPEGSVASRLARARVMLAKRLSRRGVVFSGGSVAAVLSAASAPASAPPDLVASTIKAASLLAAGKAAATGVISAKVAALTEGMVLAMFVTRIKAALSTVLILGFMATGATVLTSRMAAGQDEKKLDAEKLAEPTAKQQKEKDKEVFTAWGKEVGGLQAGLGYQPGQMRVYRPGETVKLVVRVRNVGMEVVTFQYLRHFFIENPPAVVDDKGNTVALKDGTPKGIHKPLDATLAPGKEIELYELNLTVSAKSTDTPEASTLYGEGTFRLQYERVLGDTSLSSVSIKCDPILRKLATGKLDLQVKNQKKGEAKQALAQPKQQPAKTDLERMAGLWTIVNGDRKWRDDGLGAKGQVWDIGNHQIVPDPFLTGIRTRQYFHRLDPAKSPKQIDITVTTASNKIGVDFPIDAKNQIMGVIKGIYEVDRDEIRLCLGEMGKDRPAAFPEKPKPGEVLILHRFEKAEKLQALIDKVLEAHGGEDKLNKLTSFTMTVKHSNLETQYYFVQPPKNFRWETTHPDRTSKRIVILFPEGRRWWTKEPNGDAVEFLPTGAERTMEYHLDYVKFFGPRQVLRLKDADHRVTLLDDEVKIGDRAAVGVEVKGPQFNRKMYFDKESHLLQRSGAVTYSDYKKFDGIPVAQKENDGYLLPQVTEFRAVEKFDAKLFERP
jgi:RNA polymerase sigma factor (sigma-70 family)